MATNLTAAKVRTLTKPGRYGDGGGLYLNIAKGGTKSWVQRIRVGGLRTDKGLGGFPSVSLSAARKIAVVNRVAVSEGRNPFKKAVRERMARLESLDLVPTFEEAARKIHAAKWAAGEISSEKHARNWIQMFERHVFPQFGDTPVDEISQREVKDFLERLGSELTETARRIRSRMREVFDDCIESEYITTNPSGDGIRLSVRRWSRTAKVTHFAALPYQDVQDAFIKVRDSKAMRETRLCFQFLILTACRSGEARGATWDEIDLDAGLWTIPASRMKASRDHTIPLSTQALLILQDAQDAVAKRLKRTPNYNPSGLVFAHPSGKPLSENALSLRARKDELGCTPHGFRSSFKDWATAQSLWSWELVELSLAHAVGNSVERAYFRDTLVEERRPLMQEWADHVWDVRPF